MLCEFKPYENRQVCIFCGRTVDVSGAVRAQCRSSIIRPVSPIEVTLVNPNGPGADLKAIFSELDILKLEGCQCEAHVARMNAWGVAGCREHFDEIVGWLRDGSTKFGWSDKLKAAGKAVASGLYKELTATGLFTDWRDPFPALVELAIRRADNTTASLASS